MVRCISRGFKFIVLFLAALSVGCAIQPKQEAMVPSSRVTTFEANKVFNGRIGYKPMKSPATKFDFAVETALRNQGWLNKSSSPDYYLATSRFSESIPKSGFAMSGSLLVTYTLTSSSGSQLWFKTVDTTIKKDLTDKFIGVSRAESIVEDYVRLNIAEMIEALDLKGRQISQQQSVNDQVNQQLVLLQKQFVDFDLFSGKNFFDLCADPLCSKVGNRVIIVSETMKFWLPKMKDVSAAKTQRFFNMYGQYLYAAQRSDIEELVQAKRKAEQLANSRRNEQSQNLREISNEGKGVAF